MQKLIQMLGFNFVDCNMLINQALKNHVNSNLHSTSTCALACAAL
jgi:hypothetical protein